MQKKTTNAIVIKVIPRTRDIFLYKLSSTFANRTGLFRLLISALFFAAAYILRGRIHGLVTALLVLMGLLNPVVTPIWHYISSARLSARLPTNLITFCGTKFSVNDGKKRLELDWAELYQVLMSKRLLLVYIAPQTAFIIPKDQLGEDTAAVEAIVKENAALCETVFRTYM